MKKLLLSTMIIFLAAGCVAEKPADRTTQSTDDTSKTVINKEAEIMRAKTAIKGFASALQAELKSAIKEGGPVNAITVCNTKAISISKEASEKHGLLLSRVSLKNRNAGNTPNTWQKKVLGEFETRKLGGEPVSELSYVEIVEQGNARHFRFMKAIPTKPLCLTCHGTDIVPEVKNKLDQLYPDDKARGFSVGDIRGAFVVTKEFPR